MKKLYHVEKFPSSMITPEDVYMNRRQFMKAAGVFSLGGFLAACNVVSPAATSPSPSPARTSPAGVSFPFSPLGIEVDELGEGLTSEKWANGFNNFYEFSMSKNMVSDLAAGFKTSPWEVQVDGLVEKPGIFSLEELLGGFDQEERIYRMRCVEGWSMVLPWIGFSLADFLKKVEPLNEARYVRFVSVYRPSEMPGQNDTQYPYPYTEGLRLDEAMHPLTLLATGLYGKPLLPQSGAPLRLVVPWKYGFKSLKSLVRIELTDKMPATFWNTIAAEEYGFYANVNPQKNHPRWSQAREQRIGTEKIIDTLLYNGYNEVAGLYQDLDLEKNY